MNRISNCVSTYNEIMNSISIRYSFCMNIMNRYIRHYIHHKQSLFQSERGFHVYQKVVSRASETRHASDAPHLLPTMIPKARASRATQAIVLRGITIKRPLATSIIISSYGQIYHFIFLHAHWTISCHPSCKKIIWNWNEIVRTRICSIIRYLALASSIEFSILYTDR